MVWFLEPESLNIGYLEPLGRTYPGLKVVPIFQLGALSMPYDGTWSLWVRLTFSLGLRTSPKPRSNKTKNNQSPNQYVLNDARAESMKALN